MKKLSSTLQEYEKFDSLAYIADQKRIPFSQLMFKP